MITYKLDHDEDLYLMVHLGRGTRYQDVIYISHNASLSLAYTAYGGALGDFATDGVVLALGPDHIPPS